MVVTLAVSVLRYPHWNMEKFLNEPFYGEKKKTMALL